MIEEQTQQMKARECNNLDKSLFYLDHVRMQIKLLTTSILQGPVARKRLKNTITLLMIIFAF